MNQWLLICHFLIKEGKFTHMLIPSVRQAHGHKGGYPSNLCFIWVTCLKPN